MLLLRRLGIVAIMLLAWGYSRSVAGNEVLADVGAMDEETRARVAKFVDEGGVLLRFAGPRLAAGNDPLVPVRLRRGGQEEEDSQGPEQR